MAGKWWPSSIATCCCVALLRCFAVAAVAAAGALLACCFAALAFAVALASCGRASAAAAAAAAAAVAAAAVAAAVALPPRLAAFALPLPCCPPSPPCAQVWLRLRGGRLSRFAARVPPLRRGSPHRGDISPATSPSPPGIGMDAELVKILGVFAVDEAIKTMLINKNCLKLWQFVEYVDDIKDWTGILAGLEPPITDRSVVASLRRAYKAAAQRDTELQRTGRDKPCQDLDSLIAAMASLPSPQPPVPKIRIPKDEKPLRGPVYTYVNKDGGYFSCQLCNKVATDDHRNSSGHKTKWGIYFTDPDNWQLPAAAVKPETWMGPPLGLPQQQPPPAGTEAQQTDLMEQANGRWGSLVRHLREINTEFNHFRLDMEQLAPAGSHTCSHCGRLTAATQVATEPHRQPHR